MVKKSLASLPHLADFEYAAMDCIAVELGHDAIVRESEMEVVKGYDIYPNDSKITQEELTDAVVKGMWKFSKYDLVLVWLNVGRYRDAFLKAIKKNGDAIRFEIFDRRGKYLRVGWGIKQFVYFVRRKLQESLPR
ncbi:MAG: hypothetical protein HYW89_01865 [Candidatus Sungiibacteriota bacterium]|uniref:Uncharacterized protein n=1 Tax=Candidatus Sungiibacteriota bacterium TaxID=2750080 RepID=A0A7T5RK83_9BACT|nr:MAG: hypothetical protein HYW89_01865 [Candidatus Sungbacteria bacterium]